jgi:hypothetical protein
MTFTRSIRDKNTVMNNELKDAINLYNSYATLTGFYWNLYVVIVLALLGFITFTKIDLDRRRRLLLCFAFLVFAVGNLSALINKQSMHAAMAHEVVKVAKAHPPFSDELKKKLSQVSKPLGLAGDKALHGTSWITTLIFHSIFDVMVVIAILTIHPILSRTDG